MTDKISFKRKIQEIKDACGQGEYIFRGENRHYGEISSNLYRQCCVWEEFSGDDNFPVLKLERTALDRARRHVRSAAPDIEVLTELQHYGGKTASIDFTRNMHVALFFACDGAFHADGRVILFDKSKSQRWEEAIRDFDKTIGLDSEHVGAYFNRYKANVRLGRLEEAMKDYDRGRELN